MALSQRLTLAKGHAQAKRIRGELTSFERRLRDAREYGWLGTDASVLKAEMSELEDKLQRADAEEEALAALTAVDLRRKPIAGHGSLRARGLRGAAGDRRAPE